MTTTESYGCDKHGEDAYQGCAMCDLETLRERLHEAELVAASWKREAELNEQAADESSGYAKRLAEADAHGKAQQQWAHEWREKADGLEARLAEANALLREARDKHWPFMATDGLAARIDAHLAREAK